MADITVSYKGSTIDEVSASGTKTLKTAGKYCEGDIDIEYVKPSGSSYVKLAETELTLNTTDTTAKAVGTINVPIEDIWTSNDVIYVSIRDKAGKRSGYCLGSDAWFVNANAANDTQSNFTAAARAIYSYANGQYSAVSTGYGVYAGYVSPNGFVSVYTRYNATYGTIDGTYKVEVYKLTFPDSGSPFA
jgi:hypothetical protein